MGETLVIAEGEERNSIYLDAKGYEITATDFSKVGAKKEKSLAKGKI